MADKRAEVEDWYRRYGAALLLFGVALTGDRARAQDALHQVFLRLLSKQDLGSINDARTYLFAALRNNIFNDAKRRDHEVPLNPNDGPWFECPGNNYAEELSVRQALSELPTEQREVVVLHIWGGLTFSQAAEVLAINANTAAARYRYALAKLRSTLFER